MGETKADIVSIGAAKYRLIARIGPSIHRGITLYTFALFYIVGATTMQLSTFMVNTH
jgi:hypothetical protein